MKVETRGKDLKQYCLKENTNYILHMKLCSKISRPISFFQNSFPIVRTKDCNHKNCKIKKDKARD
jgi:hypothetical protein